MGTSDFSASFPSSFLEFPCQHAQIGIQLNGELFMKFSLITDLSLQYALLPTLVVLVSWTVISLINSGSSEPLPDFRFIALGPGMEGSLKAVSWEQS